jgi:hypothetical protein
MTVVLLIKTQFYRRIYFKQKQRRFFWKPILYEARYSFRMNPPNLFLTVHLADDDPLGAIEAVLATARRGGIDLLRMELAAGTLALHLCAADTERLDLFTARLDNLIGIADLAVLDRAAA